MKKLWLLLLAASLSTANAQHQTQTFKLHPLRPLAQLQVEALKASPPIEHGEFRQSDLVELISIDPSLKLDIHYASTNNFIGTPVYSEARAFLQRPAAAAVAQVNTQLHKQGLGLLIFDGYRPWYVTKMFWEATPADKHEYLADPAGGSRHNRGCAVDLTIYSLKTGQPIAMPSGYDDFSEAAHPDYKGGTAEQRANREFLRKLMEEAGFTVYPTEWWHFDFKGWQSFPLLNVPFSKVKALVH